MFRNFVAVFCVVLLYTDASPVRKQAQKEKSDDDQWVSLSGFTAGNTKDVDWATIAENDLKRTLTAKSNRNPAKNVIFFIGDGMGVATATAARTYQTQRRGLSGNDALLAWDRFVEHGTLLTYSTDFNVPDSAASGAALFCGEKASRGTICVNQHVDKSNCSAVKGNELKSIVQHAQDEGKWTGLAVTSRVTHATPANLFAHTASRGWESDGDIDVDDRDTCTDITLQFLNSSIRVALGGGRRTFYPDGTPDPEYPLSPVKRGQRLDGRFITDEWIESKSKLGTAHYVMDKDNFNRIDPEKTDFLLGLFEASNMNFETDRNNPNIERWGEPSLAEMTEKAIKILERGPNGYFLVVEGSRIDHAHHGSMVQKALNDTVAFSDAVAKARELTSDSETLIVVTADHSHTLAINGYSNINSDVLGLADDGNKANADGTTDPALMGDGLPYLTLSYTNGPGNLYHRSKEVTNGHQRRNLSEEAIVGKIGGAHYFHDAAMLIDSATHAGEDVTIYADGPGSFLMRGVHEQNYVPHAIAYAACLGKYSGAGLCNKPDFDNSN